MMKGVFSGGYAAKHLNLPTGLRSRGRLIFAIYIFADQKRSYFSPYLDIQVWREVNAHL
jgi:hypothetical protein